MAKNLAQIRYFGTSEENRKKNFPRAVEKNDFVTGQVFYDYAPITQIGIQTVPGAKFYLNDSTDAVVIGGSGVYDLMADGTLRITKIQFDLTTLERIDKNENNYLIVDILYGEEE